MTSGEAAGRAAPVGVVRPPAEGKRARSDRLLPLIAAERTLRGILLVAVGILVVTHLKSDWGRTLNHVARAVGLDPSHNAVGHFVSRASSLSIKKRAEYGSIAIAYGLLEGVEGYGLWRRRRWAEYLTIIATALLLIPEIDELIKRPTALKAAGFLVNVVIVIYLIGRVRRKRAGTGEAGAASAAKS
jgi:uncharacterized membrane protein (DUF2068 family)